jgi:hypothetical protein
MGVPPRRRRRRARRAADEPARVTVAGPHSPTRCPLSPPPPADSRSSPASGAREGLERIADDVVPHYLIRYYTTNAKRDGSIRTIKVRLKKDGAEIRRAALVTARRPLTTSRKRPAIARRWSGACRHR